MNPRSIPLFPLNAVLFPGGPIKLRIFEPRYLDMISRCMREDSGFGVALIVEGAEAGGDARTAAIGTLARVVDFEQLSDGLLGLTAHGGARFSIRNVRQQTDRLNIASIEWLPQEAPAPIPARGQLLAELTRRAFPQVASHYAGLAPEYEDATWVGMRLAELLPLSVEDRQRCLEMLDAVERLDFLLQLIRFEPA